MPAMMMWNGREQPSRTIRQILLATIASLLAIPTAILYVIAIWFPIGFSIIGAVLRPPVRVIRMLFHHCWCIMCRMPGNVKRTVTSMRVWILLAGLELMVMGVWVHTYETEPIKLAIGTGGIVAGVFVTADTLFNITGFLKTAPLIWR
ncbi:hypothetical protein EJ08DRAFT_698970 [Tothia fuscella]|uniref:Uncharacterized protein n=1 Tax=Tothia fuscella TaxID=1048955 RepID=A0A9P4NNI4_9PEZI|nr:hypothetical protein EJ08DRAFT_698970 [Tothia fuscella]